MAHPGREPSTPPTASGPGSPIPTDPWSGSTYFPVMDTVPQPPRRGVPWWLVPVAVATAALAVATFAVVAFWPRSGDGPDTPLAFRPVAEVGKIEFGEGADPVLTRVFGDRVYAAAVVADEIEVVAADLATGEERWRKSIAGSEGQQWGSVFPTPEAVLVVADELIREDPRPLVVLDAETGEERWRRDVYGNDRIFIQDDVLALDDADGQRLAGLDLAEGGQMWEVAYPEGQFTSAATVVPVWSTADLAGPSRLDGSPAERGGGRIVLVGADRSARLVDTSTGEVEWERTNVASPADLLLAYEKWLFAADEDSGYRVLSYDLTDAVAQPRTLYTADDTARFPASSLYPCGPERVCLLDRTRDPDSTEVVVIDAAGSGGQLWRQPAPSAEELLPVGDLVVANGVGPSTVAYDQDGNEVFDRSGVAVRLNAGNLLVFGDKPSSFRDDLSLLGVQVATGDVVGLDQARGVRGSACSWGGVHLACPTSDAAIIWRFANE